MKSLARAHDLTLPDLRDMNDVAPSTTSVVALLKAILAPHDEPGSSRIAISGPDVAISGATLTSFALLLHEPATNAAKYGALSTSAGRLQIGLTVEGGDLRLECTRICFAPPTGSIGAGRFRQNSG